MLPALNNKIKKNISLFVIVSSFTHIYAVRGDLFYNRKFMQSCEKKIY